MAHWVVSLYSSPTSDRSRIAKYVTFIGAEPRDDNRPASILPSHRQDQSGILPSSSTGLGLRSGGQYTAPNAQFQSVQSRNGPLQFSYSHGQEQSPLSQSRSQIHLPSQMPPNFPPPYQSMPIPPEYGQQPQQSFQSIGEFNRSLPAGPMHGYGHMQYGRMNTQFGSYSPHDPLLPVDPQLFTSHRLHPSFHQAYGPPVHPPDIITNTPRHATRSPFASASHLSAFSGRPFPPTSLREATQAALPISGNQTAPVVTADSSSLETSVPDANGYDIDAPKMELEFKSDGEAPA